MKTAGFIVDRFRSLSATTGGLPSLVSLFGRGWPHRPDLATAARQAATNCDRYITYIYASYHGHGLVEYSVFRLDIHHDIMSWS
jgi:hypothetical protein